MKKNILIFIFLIIIVILLSLLIRENTLKKEVPINTTITEQTQNEPAVQDIPISNPPIITKEVSWEKIIQYYCEQSGGTFKNQTCECPFEPNLEQTSESQYSKLNGTCQTTAGGPGGELGKEVDICIGRQLQLNECLNKIKNPPI